MAKAKKDKKSKKIKTKKEEMAETRFLGRMENFGNGPLPAGSLDNSLETLLTRTAVILHTDVDTFTVLYVSTNELEDGTKCHTGMVLDNTFGHESIYHEGDFVEFFGSQVADIFPIVY